MSLRRPALVATVVLLGALLSPVLVATPALASEVSGTVTYSGTSAFGAWADTTLSDDLTVGVPYSSTVELPATRPWTFYDPYSSVIPDGLQVDYDNFVAPPNNPVITISGTPTTAAASTTLVLQFNAYAGGNTRLTFTGLEIKRAPTTTTLGGDDYWSYTNVTLSAGVSAGTGTIEFFLGSTSIGSSPVTGGTATFSGAVSSSFVGTNWVVTAVYSGDATNAPSTSTSDPTLYVYGDRIISGTVMQNGVGLPGVVVNLLTSTYANAGLSDTTDATGAFQIDVGEPSSFLAAKAGYALEALGLGVYYSTTWVLGGANVSFLGNATVVYEADWDSGLIIHNDIPPTWSDQTLAQPRLGSAYNDSVAASTVGAAAVYTVTGDVPSWLTFNAGSFTATNPTDQDPHTFTVRAANPYRYSERTFTLTAANAWIPPGFTDGTVATAQAGVYLDDEVLATGDGPIAYSITGGALPAWLTLDASSGQITGTAPLSAAGDYYWFTVTATGHGTANVLIAAFVAPAPTVDIDIDFAVGDVAVGSTFDFDLTGAGAGVPYSVTINSVPFVAASGLTSGLGAASGSGTIQSAIDAGAHSIVLTTLAADGTPRTVTVWFTVLSNGLIGAISLNGPIAFIDIAALASTGSGLTGSLAAALALLLAGVFLHRRRLLKHVA